MTVVLRTDHVALMKIVFPHIILSDAVRKVVLTLW